MEMPNIKECCYVMLVIIALLSIENAISDVTSSGSTTNTQSNNAGSNTAITGGYESSTTYQSGSSSNTTTNNETNNSTNQKTAVNSANAPSMSVYGQDSCVIPLAAGMTIIGFSGSFGSYYTDPNCERRKSVAVLAKLGMKVAAISLMCQDENVWKAMMNAGTPCPVDGLIGEKAKARWIEKRKGELSGQTTKPSMTWND
jgi:hypothetical protein